MRAGRKRMAQKDAELLKTERKTKAPVRLAPAKQAPGKKVRTRWAPARWAREPHPYWRCAAFRSP